MTRFFKGWLDILMSVTYSLLRVLLSPLVRILWIKKVSGVENLPRQGPYIVVANHCSYLDFICLPVALNKNIRFLAAEVFFEKKMTRALMKVLGQIKVDRKNKDKTSTFVEVASAVKNGHVIGIFPEGTRSPSGKIGKLFGGAIRIAKEHNLTVVPVGVLGTYTALSRFDRKPKIARIIEVKIGAPIKIRELQNTNEIDGIKKVMKVVAALAEAGFHEEAL